jgi:hypothetical protein
MKKLVYFAALLLTTVFASCEKEEIGGTATQATAGQWYVTVDAADGNGNVVEGLEDMFSLGRITMLTFNTAENNPKEMIVSDIGNFWDFKVKAHCDINAGTFEIAGGPDQQHGISVDITNGKILRGAAKTPSGMPADSITMDILFGDDTYAGVYYDRLRITGHRYTGLAADE